MGKRRIRKTSSLILPKTTRCIPTNAKIKSSDNSGARILKILSVMKHKTRLNRFPSAHVGDMVVCSVVKGTPDMRKQKVEAIIIRQRKPFRRKDGSWMQFDDNAAVVTSPLGEPKGSEIRGVVAKEAAERWPRLSSVSSSVV